MPAQTVTMSHMVSYVSYRDCESQATFSVARGLVAQVESLNTDLRAHRLAASAAIELPTLL